MSKSISADETLVRSPESPFDLHHFAPHTSVNILEESNPHSRKHKNNFRRDETSVRAPESPFDPHLHPSPSCSCSTRAAKVRHSSPSNLKQSVSRTHFCNKFWLFTPNGIESKCCKLILLTSHLLFSQIGCSSLKNVDTSRYISLQLQQK